LNHRFHFDLVKIELAYSRYQMTKTIDKDIRDRIGQKIEVQITCCYVIGHKNKVAQHATHTACRDRVVM
jgi:hypothetical protein